MAAKKKAKKAASAKPAVKIYSTPTCPWCERAKEFLKQHNIKYQDVNVALDAKARSEMIEKSGQMGVPVIVIGKKIIVGYNEEALREALKV